MTALHLVIAVLRRHRAAHVGALNPLTVVSFAFVPSPWLWPSTTGMAVALVAHVFWFFVCEALAPLPARRARATTRPEGRLQSVTSTSVSASRPPHSSGFEHTPVLAVLDEAADIKTFRLVRPSGFDFVAGQFVAVRIHVEDRPHVRCYSISSAPEAGGYLEISVRRQGLVSGTLHATLRNGSRLAINRPAGRFVYPAHDDRPVALVAGGIGITPLLSMLRHGITADPTRPITLLYSARREEDVAFLNELHVMADRHPQVRVAVTLTQVAAPTRWRRGRIDTAMISQYVDDPANTVFCVCGPAPMLAGVRATLSGMGVPDDQIRFEQFDTSLAAPLLNVSSAAERPEAATAVAPGLFPSAAGVHRVTFALSGRTAAVGAAHTLLDAAEAEGVSIPSSCRAGVCQSCRTRVAQGEVDCRSEILDPEDRSAGFVLPCVSWATGDCVLEA